MLYLQYKKTIIPECINTDLKVCLAKHTHDNPFTTHLLSGEWDDREGI